MKKLEFNYYNEDDFFGFLDSLPSKDAAKLSAVIDKIEKYGLEIAKQEQWTKKLGKNLYEIRSKFSNNIQRAIYFHIVDNQYIIVSAFTKKSQKTPKKEINKAVNRRSKAIDDFNKGSS